MISAVFTRADERAGDDMVECELAQPIGGRIRLRDAFIVQGNISAALKQALRVPVGDAVAEAQKGARRRRQSFHFDLLVNFFTATRKSSVSMASMIPFSSASSCCLVGVTAA